MLNVSEDIIATSTNAAGSAKETDCAASAVASVAATGSGGTNTTRNVCEFVSYSENYPFTSKSSNACRVSHLLVNLSGLTFDFRLIESTIFLNLLRQMIFWQKWLTRSVGRTADNPNAESTKPHSHSTR